MEVALAWCVAHGTVPIPGAKTAAQAQENCGRSREGLHSTERAELDAVALRGKVASRGKGGKKGGGKGTNAATGK